MTETVPPGAPEAFSLFGRPLYLVPLSPEALEQQTRLYEKALEDWRESPDDPDRVIWLGRRTAYLGRYREAAAVFSMGLDMHPGNAKLYRHRGHRFITLRRFGNAVDDFEKAAELMVSAPDEVEPDGVPNPRGEPTSTLYFNVWYHLGLSYYLTGDLERALKAYRECMKVSEMDENYVATAHWTYMALRRLGREGEAEKLLGRVEPGMDVVENTNYHQCLLMYEGLRSPEELMGEARKQGALGLVTTGYGVANWYSYNGDEERAAGILREITALEGWAGFGYIAAEADLKRMIGG